MHAEETHPYNNEDSPASSSAPPLAARVDRDLTGLTLGDFRIERLLGRGGMGEVYLASQLSLDRPIALKVLKPELLANPTYLARFEKEALSAARLNHPSIVHVYSFGDANSLKYIAMEYVEGTNLKDYLARKGVPALPLALSIMKQAGQAIAAAGESGLVHRDIKPENLLITRKGQVKVADFGLCRTSSSGALDITQEGVTLGTPMYMSPEQVKGRELDHRSDLYSLGVTFYHMLAGVPPFQAETPIALALKHVQDTPTSLAVHRPDLPADLVRLVMKLIEKNPQDRFATAHEMLQELARIRGTLNTQPLNTGSTTALVAASATTTTPTPSRAQAPPLDWKQLARPLGGFRLGRRALAGAVLLAAIAGGLTGLTRRAPNLLSARSARADTSSPAGLWMAPWEAVPAQPSAAEQYRYAQLSSPENQRIAAWLAVPGRFPQDTAWSSKAYTQLARGLFRQRDAIRLLALADQLKRSAQPQDQALARVALAGSAALRNQPEDVLGQFNETRFELLDPGIAELAFEIAEIARRSLGGAQGSTATRLDRLRDQLADLLQIGPIVRLGLIDLD